MTSGTTLRTYRLALAATNEYCVAVGGNTVAGSLAAEVLIMNRVNGVYERDVAIHMNIVANNNLITYAGDNTQLRRRSCNSANDPYTNGNGSTMLAQNQTTCNNVIGSANYDIGHVFSTGGGGIASLNGPCNAAKQGTRCNRPAKLRSAILLRSTMSRMRWDISLAQIIPLMAHRATAAVVIDPLRTPMSQAAALPSWPMPEFAIPRTSRPTASIRSTLIASMRSSPILKRRGQHLRRRDRHR